MQCSLSNQTGHMYSSQFSSITRFVHALSKSIYVILYFMSICKLCNSMLQSQKSQSSLFFTAFCKGNQWELFKDLLASIFLEKNGLAILLTSSIIPFFSGSQREAYFFTCHCCQLLISIIIYFKHIHMLQQKFQRAKIAKYT